MIIVRVRGKKGNIVVWTFHYTVVMEATNKILAVKTIRKSPMSGNIETLKSFHFKDIVSIEGR
jgi:hypothetical protein